MKYQAVLKIATGAESIGYGETDGKAVQAALADSPTMREANPANVSISVWEVYSNARDLAYCSRLSKYMDAVS